MGFDPCKWAFGRARGRLLGVEADQQCVDFTDAVADLFWVPPGEKTNSFGFTAACVCGLFGHTHIHK